MLKRPREVLMLLSKRAGTWAGSVGSPLSSYRSLRFRYSKRLFPCQSEANEVTCQGIFGMNVDVLINKPPSIRWYLAAVVPFSVLILAIAFVSTRLNKWKRSQAEKKQAAELEK
jgi:hypothetical protein